ncbi:MAG: hypothetical protein HZB67_03165 [Candidatus Aenigmarchaeota archaeon]|nr:hypothetical protein [Candidatus Aenigmarchaeota archaeon]
MKGITPVISMVLLLVITIVLSVLAFIFFGNTFRTVATGGEKGLGHIIEQSSISFNIENVDESGGIAYVRNTGNKDISNLSVYVNGERIDAKVTEPIKPGDVVAISTGPLLLETNTVKVAAGGSSQTYHGKKKPIKVSISIQSPTNTTYLTTSINLSYTVSASHSACRYELDGVNTTIADCGNRVLDVAFGWHQIVVRANDTSGNWYASQRIKFTVRNVSAAFVSISMTSPINMTYSSSTIDIKYTAKNAAQCKYELDGLNTTMSGCANTTISVPQGFHRILLWASDGTIWNTSQRVYFTVRYNTSIVPQATIFIDAGQHKGSVKDEVFGVALTGYSTSLFQKGFSTTLKNLNVKILRIHVADGVFLGGNATEKLPGLNPYRPVSLALGPRTQRYTSATNPDLSSYPAGPDEWGQRAREAGAELSIALPYGDGSEPFRNQFRNIVEYMNTPLTPAIEAQASSQGWQVNYTNPDGVHSWSSFNTSPIGYFAWLRKQANNGTDPGPYNAKYWEIGNEVFYAPTNVIHSQEYILRAINISEYMQQVDLTIKVGAVLTGTWLSVLGENVVWDAVVVNETIKDALLKKSQGKQPAISSVVPHYYAPGMFELKSSVYHKTHSFFLFNPMNMNYKLQNGSTANILKTNVTYVNSVSLEPGSYTFSIDAIGLWETNNPHVEVRLIDDGGVGNIISNSTVVINNPATQINAGHIFIDNNGEQLKTYNLTTDGSPTGTVASISLTKPTQKYRLEIIFNYKWSGHILTGVTVKNLRIIDSAGQQKAIFLDDKEWYESTALGMRVKSEMEINKTRNYSLIINAQVKNQFPETSSIPDYTPEILSTEYAYGKEGEIEFENNKAENIKVNHLFYSALLNANELVGFVNNKIDGAMKWDITNSLMFITYNDIWSLVRMNNDVRGSPQLDNTSLYSYFPDYYMFQMLSNYRGSTMVEMNTVSPKFTYSTTNAYYMLPRILTESPNSCSSNATDSPYYWSCSPNLLKQPRYSTPYLNGFATSDSSTGKLFIAIVNSNYNESIGANISIVGFLPAASATVRTFDASEAEGLLTVSSPITNMTAAIPVNSSQVSVNDASFFQPEDLVSLSSHCSGYEEYHIVSSVDQVNKKLMLNDLSGQTSKIDCFKSSWGGYNKWCAPYTCGHVVRVTNRIGIRTSTISASNSFVYTFPAHSITVLEFDSA